MLQIPDTGLPEEVGDDKATIVEGSVAWCAIGTQTGPAPEFEAEDLQLRVPLRIVRIR